MATDDDDGDDVNAISSLTLAMMTIGDDVRPCAPLTILLLLLPLTTTTTTTYYYYYHLLLTTSSSNNSTNSNSNTI